MPEEIIGLLEAEWKTLAALGSELAGQDWEKATDLPGWSVKDNFSHIIGTERTLLGDPVPEGFDEDATAPHVKNAIGEANERWVASRRSRSGAEILAELEEVTGRRLAALMAMGQDDFDREGWSPVGPAPYREFMAIRLLDTWAHEQDVRRATKRPGHQTGPVPDKCLDRTIVALPFVVGKKAAAPEASLVAFDLTGPLVRRIGIVVENGRARQDPGFSLESPLEAATAVLAMGSEPLFCLGFGRWDAETAIADGKVSLSGDTDLARAVTLAMPFMV